VGLYLWSGLALAALFRESNMGPLVGRIRRRQAELVSSDCTSFG